MTRYQELIDDEIGTAPPSTVDVNAIVSRQRKLVRVQRAGVAVAAGVVAAALVTGVGILQQAGGVRSPDVTALPSPSASPSPSPTQDPRAAEAARLTGELRPLLAALLPNAGYKPFPQDDGPAGDALVFVDRGGYFIATAEVRDTKGPGGLKVLTGDLSSVYGTPECPAPDEVPLDVKISCDMVPGPDGATVMRLTMTRGKFMRHLIFVHRPDGKSVAVEVMNGTKNFVSTRPNPPLTRDQAISLATRPTLATTL